MFIIQILLTIVALITVPPLSLVLGEWLAVSVLAMLNLDRELPRETSRWIEFLTLGTLLWLSLVLVATLVGLPLHVAALLPVFPALFRLERLKFYLSNCRYHIGLNFLLWVSVVLACGVALFNTYKGISTPWVNNYGDLTWHLGVITSFVFGDNLPPENHLFAGARLSYPFFVNLWSAALWSFCPRYTVLSYIFLYQWLFCWLLIFWALRGETLRIAPWAAFFGGGSYVVFNRALGLEVPAAVSGAEGFAHNLFGVGYPWAPFLTTIWVTQRPAMFGALIVVVSVTAFLRGYRQLFGAETLSNHVLPAADQTSQILSAQDPALVPALARAKGLGDIVISALIVGFSLLVHTHFFVVAALFILGMLSAQILVPSTSGRRVAVSALLLAFVGLTPSFLFAPWVVGKSNLVHLMGGWMQEPLDFSAGYLFSIKEALKMFFQRALPLWYVNAWPWLLSCLAIVFALRDRRWFIVCLVIFVLGNLVGLSAWNWDQMKIFIALYLVTLSVWVAYECPKIRALHWLMLALVLPAMAELGVALKSYRNSEVYSAAELDLAKNINASFPKEAVFAAAPDHNSPITITGRKLYSGYEGTLWSHAIDSRERREILADLPRLINCFQDPVGKQSGCPDYLLWTDRERRFWKSAETMPQGVEPTTVVGVFKLRR